MSKSKKRPWRDLEQELPSKLGLAPDLRPQIAEHDPRATLSIPSPTHHVFRRAVGEFKPHCDDEASPTYEQTAAGLFDAIIDRLDGLIEFAVPSFGKCELGAPEADFDLDRLVQSLQVATPGSRRLVGPLMSVFKELR